MSRMKRLKLVWCLMAGLLVLGVQPAAAETGVVPEIVPPSGTAAGPKLIDWGIYNQYEIYLLFDKNLTESDDTSLFLEDFSHIRVNGGTAPLWKVELFGPYARINMWYSMERQTSLTVDIDQGAFTAIDSTPVQAVSGFRVVTMTGKQAILNEMDPDVQGFTVADALQYIAKPGTGNLVGPAGIGKEDMRYLLEIRNERPNKGLLSPQSPEFPPSHIQWGEELLASGPVIGIRPATEPTVVALKEKIAAAKLVEADLSATGRQVEAVYLELDHAIVEFRKWTELSATGAVAELTVSPYERIVSVPPGITVEQLLSGIHSTLPIEVYPSVFSTTESSPTDLVTSNTAIKVVGTNISTFSVMPVVTVNSMAELQAAVADPTVEKIVIDGTIVDPTVTLTINRTIRFGKATEASRLEVNNIIITYPDGEMYPPHGEFLTLNASTESELAQRLTFYADYIRVAGIDNYTGLLSRRGGLTSPIYYARADAAGGTAYVSWESQLKGALADPVIDRIYLVGDIMLPGTETFAFPADRNVSFAAAAPGRTLHAGTYAFGPDIDRLTNVTIAGTPVGRTLKAPLSVQPKGTSIADGVFNGEDRSALTPPGTAPSSSDPQFTVVLPANTGTDDYAAGDEIHVQAGDYTDVRLEYELTAADIAALGGGDLTIDLDARAYYREAASHTFTPKAYVVDRAGSNESGETAAAAPITIDVSVELRLIYGNSVYPPAILGATCDEACKVYLVGQGINESHTTSSSSPVYINTADANYEPRLPLGAYKLYAEDVAGNRSGEIDVYIGVAPPA